MEKLPPLSPAQLREQAAAALGELEDFQSQACAGRVADILRHTLPQDVEERLKEIQGQLKLYEDDIAEELLNQLVNKLEKEDGAND